MAGCQEWAALRFIRSSIPDEDSHKHRVDYGFGLARNQRVRRIIGPQMWEATQQSFGASSRER